VDELRNGSVKSGSLLQVANETAKKSNQPDDRLRREEPPRADAYTSPGGDGSLASWLRLQKSLSEKTGAAMMTLDPKNAVIGQVENDNSICQAMMASPEQARLCGMDCGRAYERASDQGRIDFRCHAGLHSFAFPVTLERRQLVVMGGRAFNTSSEFDQFLEKYGRLDSVENGSALRNIKFISARELYDAAELARSGSALEPESPAPARLPAQESGSKTAAAEPARNIRLVEEFDARKQAIGRLYEFLRTVAVHPVTTTPGTVPDARKDYENALADLGDIMESDRISLMIFNEQSNDLTVEAAYGFEAPQVRVKLGDPVAGAVLASESPMLVRDCRSDARVPDLWRSRYSSESFISFPIVLGPRKVGVLNITGRKGGSVYDSRDLSMVELVASHMALVIDRAQWHSKAEQFQQMSLTDPLTGLPNRRYLEERLYQEVERAKRHGTPLSFMIIDVDRFKRYNDLYGHTSADQVLIKTAHTLRRSVRAIDMSARFAGDEFCIVMPETEIGAAANIAERVGTEVGKAECRSEQGESMGRITISVGVSSFSATRQSPLAIIETADRALYQAKTRGRNCVVVYEDADDRLDFPPDDAADNRRGRR
jgi:diguanylate cyclase (GGDEF)-like protein